MEDRRSEGNCSRATPRRAGTSLIIAAGDKATDQDGAETAGGAVLLPLLEDGTKICLNQRQDTSPDLLRTTLRTSRVRDYNLYWSAENNLWRMNLRRTNEPFWVINIFN